MIKRKSRGESPGSHERPERVLAAEALRQRISGSDTLTFDALRLPGVGGEYKSLINEFSDTPDLEGF